MTGLRVLILATMAASAAAWTTQLSETSLPTFRTASSGELVRWTTGPHNMALASVDGVRINDNRIRVLHAPLDATPLFSTPCARHADALCVVTGDGLVDSLGVGNGSLIFPVQQPVQLDPEFKFRGCSRGEGRVVVTGGRYDISACDVFDSNLDIVFQNNQLSVFRVEVDAALYGWLGVTCIVAVVVITQNLAADLFDDSPDAAHPVDVLWCVALGVALLVLSALFPGPEADTPGVCSDWRQFSCRLFYPLLVRSDRVFLAGVFLYVLVHILCGLGPTVLHWLTYAVRRLQNAAQGYDLVPGQQSTAPPIRSLHSVNFLVACILVSVVSTHGSAETPLTAPLVFVLLFRAAFKMLKMQRTAAAEAGASATDSVLEPFLVASDCLLILACVVFGVVPNAGSECEAVTFFAMLLAVAVMLAYEAVQRSSSLQAEAQQRQKQPRQDTGAATQQPVGVRSSRQAAQMHSHMLSFV